MRMKSLRNVVLESNGREQALWNAMRDGLQPSDDDLTVRREQRSRAILGVRACIPGVKPLASLLGSVGVGEEDERRVKGGSGSGHELPHPWVRDVRTSDPDAPLRRPSLLDDLDLLAHELDQHIAVCVMELERQLCALKADLLQHITHLDPVIHDKVCVHGGGDPQPVRGCLATHHRRAVTVLIEDGREDDRDGEVKPLQVALVEFDEPRERRGEVALNAHHHACS